VAVGWTRSAEEVLRLTLEVNRCHRPGLSASHKPTSGGVILNTTASGGSSRYHVLADKTGRWSPVHDWILNYKGIHQQSRPPEVFS
jgi:hypothetical protein